MLWTQRKSNERRVTCDRLARGEIRPCCPNGFQGNGNINRYTQSLEQFLSFRSKTFSKLKIEKWRQYECNRNEKRPWVNPERAGRINGGKVARINWQLSEFASRLRFPATRLLLSETLAVCYMCGEWSGVIKGVSEIFSYIIFFIIKY